MSEKDGITNRFELAVLAGARARQLLRGCTPRIDGSLKPARLAAIEITEGHVGKATDSQD